MKEILTLDICPSCKQKIKLIPIKGGDKETGQAYKMMGDENSISLSSCKQKIEWLEKMNKELLEACKQVQGMMIQAGLNLKEDDRIQYQGIFSMLSYAISRTEGK